MDTRRVVQGAQALLFAMGRRVPIRGPAKLAWEVTEQCNSRCLTCDRRNAAPGELSPEEGLSLIRQAAALGVLSMSFSGGEPLLRRDLPLLVREASAHRVHTSISTNGLLLRDELLATLTDAGLCTIYLSLDGHEDTHDMLRGVPGGFRRAREAAAAIVRRGGRRPRVFYNMTVSRANMREVPRVADLALADGVDGLTVQPAQIADTVGLVPNPDLVLSPDDAEPLAAILDAVQGQHPRLVPLPRRYLAEMAAFVRDPAISCRIPCVAGVIHGVVGSTGEVYPCPVQFASMGNLRHDTLQNIWKGRQARDVRRRIARGNHPPCWFNCVVPASLILHRLLPFGWLGLIRSPAMRHLARRTTARVR